MTRAGLIRLIKIPKRNYGLRETKSISVAWLGQRGLSSSGFRPNFVQLILRIPKSCATQMENSNRYFGLIFLTFWFNILVDRSTRLKFQTTV